MSKAPREAYRVFGLVPSLLLVCWLFLWFSHTVADPDLWGHLRFGEDLLRAGSIIERDSYSYRTEGQRWFNHEWMFEVLAAAIYDSAGSTGLVAAKLLATAFILGACFAHLRRQGLGPYRAIALLALASIPFRLGMGTIRPQIATYVMFLLLLLILNGAANARHFSLWSLPVLFTVWVNLHGGVLAGIAVLGLWIAARVIARVRDTATPVLGRLRTAVFLGSLGVVCCAALVVNPYGIQLPVFLLRTATVPRPEISEWTALGLLSLPGLIYLALIAIGIAGLVATTRRRRPEQVAILSATAVMAVVSNRHYPLFALSLVILAGEHIADVWNRWWPASRPNAMTRGFAFLGLVISLALVVASVPRFGCIRIEPFYFAFPARAVEFVRQSGVRGNMAVPFSWGEYVLWHLGPGTKVSIDGRRETVYSDQVYQQSIDFERGTGSWDAVLKTAPTDLVLVQDGSPTANLLSQTREWTVVYRDSSCLLFARNSYPGRGDLMRRANLAVPDDGRGLCFPGPERGY
jgi:hypothetical protein